VDATSGLNTRQDTLPARVIQLYIITHLGTVAAAAALLAQPH